jgi:hypothetical protein
MHPLTYNFAYHVDSTTLADGDYELIPEQGVESAEDPGNAVEELTEAPNQSSENFETPGPNYRCLTGCPPRDIPNVVSFG